MCKTNETFTIEDSLNRMQIDQLHNATLNFSNNSLETKKLCVTAQIASVTILVGFHANNKLDNLYGILGASSLLIALLFYIVDIFLYYYQDKLRDAMIKEENKIRLRHGLPLQVFARKQKSKKTKCILKKLNPKTNRMVRSILNGSQVMYWILIVVSILVLLKFN